MTIGAATRDAMTPDQQAVFEAIASGPRGSVPTPFRAMLDAPDLCRAVQNVGAVIRYGSDLDDRTREVAICAAAAAWGSGYEWTYHDALAIEAGLTAAERQSILDGHGDALPCAEASIVAYVATAVRARRADADHLARIVETYGRRAATEITAIAGYYPLLALFLDAADLDTPLPTTPSS